MTFPLVDLNKFIVEVASDDLDTGLKFIIADGFKDLKVNDTVKIRQKWSDINGFF